MERDDSTRIVLVCDVAEARLFNHACVLCLFGELANTFDEVLIAGTIVCEQLTQERDCTEAVIVVDLFEARDDNIAELEAHEAATGPENPMCLSQRFHTVRYVPHAK